MMRVDVDRSTQKTTRVSLGVYRLGKPMHEGMGLFAMGLWCERDAAGVAMSEMSKTAAQCCSLRRHTLLDRHHWLGRRRCRHRQHQLQHRRSCDHVVK